MSEYWKSIPKYWCKYCQTFVKDTAIEKKNHEATGKHQGSLQRFLRGLHKDNEREQRDKQRAKDEVNRLNGVARSSPFAPGGAHSTASSASGGDRNATPADRKRQLQQLADMGIAVPEDFRRETAMAGDWEVTSRRIIREKSPDHFGVKKEEDEGDSKDGPAVSIGVRKRKHEDEEEEEQLGSRAPRKGWGTSVRSLPGGGGADDLEVLLSQTKPKVTAVHEQEAAENTTQPLTKPGGDIEENQEAPVPVPTEATIKQEATNFDSGIHQSPGPDGESAKNIQSDETPPQIKHEDPAPPVVFKKRKPKQNR